MRKTYPINWSKYEALALDLKQREAQVKRNLSGTAKRKSLAELEKEMSLIFDKLEDLAYSAPHTHEKQKKETHYSKVELFHKVHKLRVM